MQAVRRQDLDHLVEQSLGSHPRSGRTAWKPSLQEATNNMVGVEGLRCRRYIHSVKRTRKEKRVFDFCTSTPWAPDFRSTSTTRQNTRSKLLTGSESSPFRKLPRNFRPVPEAPESEIGPPISRPWNREVGPGPRHARFQLEKKLLINGPSLKKSKTEPSISPDIRGRRKGPENRKCSLTH